jgi:hypothetical protein
MIAWGLLIPVKCIAVNSILYSLPGSYFLMALSTALTTPWDTVHNVSFSEKQSGFNAIKTGLFFWKTYSVQYAEW